MNARFTPGPWEADRSSVYADNGIIADLYLDDATADANANLIASAPELYAALVEIWEIVGPSLGNAIEAGYPNERHAAAKAKADAALAKARGQ